MISTVAVTMSCNGKSVEYANAFPDAFPPDFWSCRVWHQGLRPVNAHLGFNQEACRKRWPGTSTENFQVCSLVRVTGRPRHQYTHRIANKLTPSFFSTMKLTSNSLRHCQESQGKCVCSTLTPYALICFQGPEYFSSLSRNVRNVVRSSFPWLLFTVSY